MGCLLLSASGATMTKLTFTTCALALASVALAQMIVPADARSRHHRRGHAVAASGQNVTGGRAGRDNSAAGGNASQPSRPGAQGSGGSGGGGGQ